METLLFFAVELKVSSSLINNNILRVILGISGNFSLFRNKEFMFYSDVSSLELFFIIRAWNSNLYLQGWLSNEF